MTALVGALFLAAVQYGIVLSSPSLRLMAPGGERAACVQGSEVMGGAYSNLPPCPPWVDSEGGCHIGDENLTRDQCLGLMTKEEYEALPRGRPPLIQLPPAVNRPRPIQVRPPGWPAVGDPPGGWPPSHPPGSPETLYGPPGTFVRNGPAGDRGSALPPSMRNFRRPSYRSSGSVSAPGFGTSARAPPSPPAPPAPISRSERRSKRNRKLTKRKRGLRWRRRFGGSNFWRSLWRRNSPRKNSSSRLFAPPKFEH